MKTPPWSSALLILCVMGHFMANIAATVSVLFSGFEVLSHLIE